MNDTAQIPVNDGNDAHAATAIVTDIAPVTDANLDEESRAYPTLPGYEILMELGRGGMGVVYLARQSALRRLVAIKVMLTGHHAGTIERGRFQVEAEAVARLQHPNIVQIHEVGEHEGLPYFSLEYVDGMDLERRMRAAPFQPREAAAFLATLARAMHYAHERGIVHRDLKPSNILLTKDGTPKITDFSLAKLIDGDTSLTPAQAVIGTPNYMSPEQAAGGTRDAGPAADIYSLGAIFYELLAGRPPFKGTSVMETLEQLLSAEPVPVARLRSHLPRELNVIPLTCLAKDPGKRYSSALALAEDLERFLAGKPIRARATPLWSRTLKWVRRRPTTAVTLTAAAVMLTSLGVALPRYRNLSEQASLRHADQEYREFVQLRDKAFFHGMMATSAGSLFTGADLGDQRSQAGRFAEDALRLAGVRSDSKQVELRSFTGASAEQVRTDCHALLLIRANAVAGNGQAQASARTALRILELAPKLGPITRAYELQHAELMERLGQMAAAADERQQAAQVPLRTALDHFLAGESLYRMGRASRAAEEFEKALELRPEDFWSRFYRAVCALHLQRWEAARTGFSACLVQQPDFAWIHVFRSLANEKLHAFAAAEADFQQALERRPSDDARYIVLVNRGVLHFEQKEYERAASDFREAVQVKPAQYHARFNLARALLEQKHFEEAAVEAAKAMQLHPPPRVVVAYHLERARAFCAAKDYPAAADATRTALQVVPDEPSAHRVLAFVLYELERYGDAMTELDRYTRCGGKPDADVLRLRGRIRMKRGAYVEAADDYSRALQLQPSADLYLHRGWAYFFADGWKLSLRDFDQAVHLDSGNADGYTGRGLALVMLGQYQQATVDADAALKAQPATPEMMHNIACIFAQSLARWSADAARNESPTLGAYYKRCALDTVRKTVQMVPAAKRRDFWMKKIAPDAALEPVRNCPEFQAIAKEAQAVAPPL